MSFSILKINLKENKIILKAYTYFLKFLFSLDPLLPMSAPIKLYYFISTSKRLDLNNPEGFNEKIQWLKVYYRDPLYVKCADKYSVRDYVKQQGCEEILNELYRVYENVEEINFEELPNRFALKTTHGSGTNIICDDKTKLDIEVTKAKVKNG